MGRPAASNAYVGSEAPTNPTKDLLLFGLINNPSSVRPNT